MIQLIKNCGRMLIFLFNKLKSSYSSVIVVKIGWHDKFEENKILPK